MSLDNPMGLAASIRDDIIALTTAVLTDVPVGSTIRVAYIPGAPRVQKRVEGAAESEALIQEARKLRESWNIPFWHALFLVGEMSASGVPEPILRSALYHQDQADARIVPLLVGDETPAELADLCGDVPDRNAVALLSRVTLPLGEERYIPMLDFSSKSSRVGSPPTVRAAMEALEVPGLLFASARSYHFYGSELVTRDQQLEFWARALLMTPIVDERWIAHQIRNHAGALRISANEKGIVPKILARVPPPATI